LGFGANARAALITRGLAEIGRLSSCLGAKPETLMGLAGLGDLVLTCTDNQSRNRRFGLLLARGMSPEQATEEIGQVVEGAKAAPLALSLADEKGLDLPITQQVVDLIAGKITPLQAVSRLMERRTGQEFT
jgi:glycerol-3-phosphate dehydrogenase (NAD(P)+)